MAALIVWAITGRDSGSSTPVPAAVAPPSALRDVSPQAVTAATQGIEQRSAGRFELLGAPTDVSSEAGVAAGGGAKKTPTLRGPARYLTGDAGLAGRRAINAVAVTIQIAPQVFPGFKTPCAHIIPVLAAVGGPIMAGNFKDGDGGCYVWLNLPNIESIPAGDLCKLALHELGHLAGLQHSDDPADVMHSPFISQPTPAPCTARAAAAGK